MRKWTAIDDVFHLTKGGMECAQIHQTLPQYQHQGNFDYADHSFISSPFPRLVSGNEMPTGTVVVKVFFKFRVVKFHFLSHKRLDKDKIPTIIRNNKMRRSSTRGKTNQGL